MFQMKSKRILNNEWKARLDYLKKKKQENKVWTADQEEIMLKWVTENGEKDLIKLSVLLKNKSIKRIKEKLLAMKSQPKRKKVVIRNMKIKKLSEKTDKPNKQYLFVNLIVLKEIKIKRMGFQRKLNPNRKILKVKRKQFLCWFIHNLIR